MLVKSTLFLLSFFLLDDPVHQAPKFRTSEVVVQEIRELLDEIETDSPLISNSNVALAAGLVKSDRPKMADWLQEWEQSTENLARIDRKIRLERSVRRSVFAAMQSCLAFWARQNCDANELLELSRLFSYPEHQLDFLIAAISDY